MERTNNKIKIVSVCLRFFEQEILLKSKKIAVPRQVGSRKMDSKLCRVCLNKSASLSVFDKQDDDIQYSTKIMRIVNIAVVEGDGLPDAICNSCAEELSTSYEFVNKCEATDQALRCAAISDLKAEASATEMPIRIDDIKQELKIDDELLKQELKPDDELHFLPEMFDDFLPDSSDNYKVSKKLKKKYKKRDNVVEKIDRRKLRPKSGPVPCEVCGLMSTCRSALETHMRTHTGEKPFACHSCNAQFNLKGTLNRHILNHHTERERKFVCETCGSSFYTKDNIKIHIRVHTGEKPYSCVYCGKTFRQTTSLIRHKRMHTGEAPYSCQICSKTFKDKSHLLRHSYVHSDEKNFTCDLCSKSVKSRNALKTHMRTHSCEKHNICNYCGMTFSLKGNLQVHIRRKHSERSGECSICLKTFPDLEVHLRKHTGEKPFVCKLCNQSFGLQGSLANHINFKHKNTSKFKCSIGECTKTFPSASMLEFHLLKYHTNHTPYICQHCSRGFFRSCDLTKHLKISHMDSEIKIPVKDLIQ